MADGWTNPLTDEVSRRARTRAGLSDEKASRVMIGLREGRTPRSFYVTIEVLKAYCDAHPEYAREALPLIQANAEAAKLRKGAHIRDKTHCINGHSLAEHARVAIHKGWKTRQCRACETMRYRRGGVMKVGVLEKVTARIIAGSPINAFTKSGKDGYLVKFDTLARHRRENPEFDRFVLDATKDNNSKGQKLRWQRVRNAAVRDQNNDYYKIRAMLPANFPGRDDVVSAIFEDLIDGSLQRENVRACIPAYMAAHNRMFPTKFAKFGDGKLVSLDEVLFDDGTMTRGDTVTRGLWD
jgi:hypothetical protein